MLSDSFVNSQEWTLSRSVPELKVVSNIFMSLFHSFMDSCQFKSKADLSFHMKRNIWEIGRTFFWHRAVNSSSFFIYLLTFTWELLARRCRVAYSGTQDEWQFWARLVTHSESVPTRQESTQTRTTTAKCTTSILMFSHRKTRSLQELLFLFVLVDVMFSL